MVFKNIGKFHHGQVTCGRANGLEGGVVGSKHSNVHGRVKSGDKVGLGQGASNCAQASLLGCVRNVLWDSQDLVDNVYDSASEIDILKSVNKCR